MRHETGIGSIRLGIDLRGARRAGAINNAPDLVLPDQIRQETDRSPRGETLSYRNPKLLSLAKDCPECMRCGAWNEGQIVAAHSNSLTHGKGMGQKSHDLPAYLCWRCHDLIDGRTPGLTPEERDLQHLQAFYLTWLWLMESGNLAVRKGA